MRFSVFLLLLLISPVLAIPNLISLDGFLTDSSGSTLSGSYSFVFSLYNVSSGGSAIWTETQTITVSSGKLNALLGSVTALNLPFDKDYYLEVSINSETLSPRYDLVSSPYAYSAASADSFTTSDAAPVSCDAQHLGSVFYNSSSNLFLGCGLDGVWSVLGGGVGTEDNPGLSCSDLLEIMPSATSGVYWIKPTDTSFQAYCDMETDGGGWTLVAQFHRGSSYWRTDSANWGSSVSGDGLTVSGSNSKKSKAFNLLAGDTLMIKPEGDTSKYSSWAHPSFTSLSDVLGHTKASQTLTYLSSASNSLPGTQQDWKTNMINHWSGDGLPDSAILAPATVVSARACGGHPSYAEGLGVVTDSGNGWSGYGADFDDSGGYWPGINYVALYVK